MTHIATRIRRCRAQAAIDAHGAIASSSGEESLIDLLTDLRHWANGKRYDFDVCLELSEVHYHAETGGEP